MSLTALEYYEIINGESSLEEGVWIIDYDKRHAFSVSSDVINPNPSVEQISLPPSDESVDTITEFSNKLNQKINNTRIVSVPGGEEVELELDDRIVTIIMDQSGSMTWNDNGNLRHDLANDLIDKIDSSYPGNVCYNVMEYGAKFINALFFGLIEEEGVNPYDVNTLSAMVYADEDANYAGIRVVRKDDGYPTEYAGIDGEIIEEGFISKILDSDLIEGQTYYYGVYTYDNNLKFSDGLKIKVTPMARIVPRGVSVFRTVVESDDLSKGIAFSGTGVNRDSNVIGLWHMDEGQGRYLYDFSNSGLVVSTVNPEPQWYASRYVPSGTSGLFFNGDTDWVSAADPDNLTEVSFSGLDNKLTIGLWVYPYDLTSPIFVSRDDGLNYNYVLATDPSGNLSCHMAGAVAVSTLTLETYKWQYIAMTYDGGANVTFYMNDQTETIALGGAVAFTSSSAYSIYLGNGGVDNILFRGRMTEVSIHNIARSASYLAAQLIDSPIYDGDNIQVDTEYIGIRDDNGDRLVVLEYQISEDYDFSGGQITIVKNEEHIPSWEEDGTILYQATAEPGQYFVSDSDDFVLGETYYYRIFSENSQGNISFLSDSPSLSIDISDAATNDYFVDLSLSIPSPSAPDTGQLATAGNKKVYLHWKQSEPVDSRIARTKIYYSHLDYPGVDAAGGYSGTLVFTGMVNDNKFVHRGLTNGDSAYYTIVNVDRYGRPSNYSADGERESDFLQAVIAPFSTADESDFPLVDVDNLHYELVDNTSISIGWNQPPKSSDDVEAYFDQTVLLYASITDEFGAAISEDTSIKMYISANIGRETQGEDVFTAGELVEFDDIDAYDFFVTRTDDGFMKATLRMTSDNRIISQIRTAVFTVQLKAYIPKDSYTAPNTGTASIESLEEYASTVAELTGDEQETTSAPSSDNIFEYFSAPIRVTFTNPWEIELVSRDNQTVYQQCYLEKTNDFGDKYLADPREIFYGVYMRASAPFVARAKVKYKGEPVESGSLDIAVWDADSSNLCDGAGDDSSWGYQGDKLQPSSVVLPPDGTMNLLQGTEVVPGVGEVAISYVDIPLYAPDMPQAVRLFVKGTKSGYSSVQEMYILFQNIMRINLNDNAPVVDGKDIAEQIAEVYIINPDYPGEDTYAKSLITSPSDLSIMQWSIRLVRGDIPRGIYSTDNVPVTNKICSYTRNGVARNVFLGPVHPGEEAIDEIHEITATIVYEGLTAEAKGFVYLKDDPDTFDRFGARFLMEVDDSPRSDTSWGGGGWLSSDNPGNALWADGFHFKRMKIHRDPVNATVAQFRAAPCFAQCASQDDSQLFELNSGQLVNIVTGDDNLEILHGEIYEDVDPYTGEYSLRVGENGFVDYGSAFVELVPEDDPGDGSNFGDVTYFYIRANKFVPGSGPVRDPECDDEREINDCTCLGSRVGTSDDPLTECDLPEWNPVVYVSGTTTLFVNNQPLVLTGGGNFYNGIPPCPICLLEPLSVEVLWRRVTNYFYSEVLGEPANDYIYSVVTEADDNYFKDVEGNTLIRHDSDIDIRVKILWKGGAVPDDTPVYVSMGDNTGNTTFVASQNIYYTHIDLEEGYSYVDVEVSPRTVVDVLTTEDMRIYSIYDENGKTDRDIGVDFTLTMGVKDDTTVVVESHRDPSADEEDEEEASPFSNSVHRYDIIANEWLRLKSMEENRGDVFHGVVGNNIYIMGGLKNNSFNMSNRNEVYDIIANSWSDSTAMSSPRFGGMSVTVGDDIYLIGGIANNNLLGGALSVSTALEVYHTVTNTWEPLTNMPTEGTIIEEVLGVAYGTARHVQIDKKNYIYVMGGIQEIVVSISQFYVSKYNDRILRYSIEDDTWETSGVLRTDEMDVYPRVAPLSIVYDNKLIVFGGAIDSSSTGSGEFDYPLQDFYIDIEDNFSIPASGKWVNTESGFMSGFPVPKLQAALAKYDENPSTDKADYFIVGGKNDYSQNLDLVERIIADGALFSYQNSYEPNPSVILTPMPVPKHGAAAEVSSADGGPYLYVLGGYTSARDSSFVDIDFTI